MEQENVGQVDSSTQNDTAATGVSDSETSSTVSEQEDIGKQGSEQEQIVEYDLGGEKWSQEKLLQAIADHKNKSEWQKKQTQRDQELASERKKYADYEQRSQALSEYENMDKLCKEHPEYARRLREMHETYFKDLETDPDIQQKSKFAQMENKLRNLEEKLYEKDVAIQKFAFSKQALDVQTKYGLTDDETNDVLMDAAKGQYPNVEAAFLVRYKDKLIAKVKQETEKEVLENLKKKGQQVGKKTGSSGASAQSRKQEQKLDLEDVLKKGGTVEEWLATVGG